MKIAVILPSRGLIFSKTADEILQNLKKVPHKIYFSHKRPIPECFNEPLEMALKDKTNTHIWFVEDDMVLSHTTLWSMTLGDRAVVTADYPVNKKGRGSVFSIDDKVIFCGTGCLLVKREVFDELQRPVFRTDIKWNMKNFGDFIKMTPSRILNDGYGLHDITFCMELMRLNIPIHSINTTLSQRKLISLGKAGSNKGAHKIEIWSKIKKDFLLKQIRSLPVEKTGNLVTVDTAEGPMNVTKGHAERLIEKGLAKALPQRKLIIDWGEYEAARVPDNA